MSRQGLRRFGEVAIVLVLVAGTGYLGKMLHHNYVTHASAPSDVRKAPAVIPVTDGAGASAALAVEGRERPLLLLVMRTTCPFCEENMPNWDELATDLAPLGDRAPELVVLSVSQPDETRAYLAGHGLDVAVRYVDPAVLPLLGLVGYPSTVAIDPETRSLSVWDGVLEPGDRAAIRAWSGVVESVPVAAVVGR